MAASHGPGSRVTQAEVARAAGVSVGAVSQVLNDSPTSRISEEVRERILAAASALGYRPNMVARTLRTSESRTYGFVSDTVTITRFASGILRGALDAAHESGYLLLIAETAGDAARETEAVQALLDRGVDGIVFTAVKSRYSGTLGMGLSVPCVNVNIADADAPSILPDELAGGRLAVRALAEAGHRHGIALVGHDFRSDIDTGIALTGRRRLDGIAAEMASVGIDFLDQQACGDWQTDEGYAAAHRMISNRGVTALLCLNDRLAFGAYQALAEAGLRIPDDVSVMSFDDEELAASLRPGLTTVAIPHETMGALAIEMLRTPGPAESDVLVPMSLHERVSVTAPAPHRAGATPH
ncbi:LacI family DNA-binding transcriptional regulator [Georgenia faecalis]|uniref:LacI family DNA-binding transcriptional regulator n=1 Tax=Georgenia faecalis TaxID=2483799 RepID=A0ABV9DBH9_9MICO|nr:LacI family DNA-binding transcriptional regulator [Georgenia faecalis]